MRAAPAGSEPGAAPPQQARRRPRPPSSDGVQSSASSHLRSGTKTYLPYLRISGRRSCRPPGTRASPAHDQRSTRGPRPEVEAPLLASRPPAGSRPRSEAGTRGLDRHEHEHAEVAHSSVRRNHSASSEWNMPLSARRSRRRGRRRASASAAIVSPQPKRRPGPPGARAPLPGRAPGTPRRTRGRHGRAARASPPWSRARRRRSAMDVRESDVRGSRDEIRHVVGCLPPATRTSCCPRVCPSAVKELDPGPRRLRPVPEREHAGLHERLEFSGRYEARLARIGAPGVLPVPALHVVAGAGRQAAAPAAWPRGASSPRPVDSE